MKTSKRTIFLLLAGIASWLTVECLAQEIHSLPDTMMVKHSIDRAAYLYENFERDSSLYYASQALLMSEKLIRLEMAGSDSSALRRLQALKVQSYVVYSNAISGTDIQAAEDSLMAGLKMIGETGGISEKAALYSAFGSLYDRKGQNDKALENFKKAMELYQKAGDKKNFTYQLIQIGIILRVMGKYGESLEYLMEALKTSRQVNDIGAIVESLLAMGFVYAFVERWEDALRCQKEALGIYQQENDIWGIARIHNDMGVTYNLAGELDSALIQHQAALAIRLQSNDSYNTFASYSYIGDIFAAKGNFLKAIENYENAIPYGHNAPYQNMVVDAHLRLGKFYLLIQDEEKSLIHMKKALQLSQEIGDPGGQSRAAIALAKMYLAGNERQKAIEMLRQAEEKAPEATLKFRRDIYKEVAEAYSKLGDHKNAYLNSLIYSEVKDLVSAEENMSKIIRLTNMLEFENELALKKESNEKIMAIKEAQLNRERFSRNIFLSGMILAVLLVIITFVRFIEKKKLSRKLNETLGNLRETQMQLVYTEKMASLGELTAGVAHEIQNPLNFVNNFSEVSKELIREMNDELALGTEASIQLAKEISQDIEQNLEKINHHGKRADAIVKGMLQHSRTSTGQKEPTDINALADEYLRLSYHGLRAKDKSFNAMFATGFDPGLPKINVVPQDFGRVLLNLINNAFYAVSEKQKNLSGLDKEYKPTVNVSTRNLGDQIEISVKDNGSGIPEEIKNKIFQPFFTTKPTGQGTGLGLSLSYDIIKAHKGQIKLKSNVGEGTEFIIVLPK